MPIIKRLIHILVPDTCIYCGCEGSLVCAPCLPAIVSTKQSTCFSCNRQTQDFITCQRCRRTTSLERVYIASYYEGDIKELIYRFKYKNAVAVAEPLAGIIAAHMMRSYDVIVPVPSSSQRFRQRGYNQSILIGKALGRRISLPCVEVLGRLSHNRQVGGLAGRNDSHNCVKKFTSGSPILYTGSGFCWSMT